MRNNEFHVFGPPGTGKTTWLMAQIEKALVHYAPEQVLVASFTRSAAKELVLRGIPIPETNVGTLHALCYRALGRPKIAETRMAEFNSRHPEYQLSLAGSVDPDDPNNSCEGFGGDSFMSQMQTLRAKMTPTEEWPTEVVEFKEVWDQWCYEAGYLDFTMLIEEGIKQFQAPPDGQVIGFFDEAQDFTSLEFTLIRQWANYMDKVIVVGDDDQAIYGFKGGDPAAFINEPIPEENNIYLKRSYRLPSQIVDYSLEWIEQVEDRQEKVFDANREGGTIEMLPASYKQPDQIVEEAVDLWQSGKADQIMILASCSYMLDPIKAYMYANGVPFHNPYRVKRGDWNPIRFKSTKQKSMVRRVLDMCLALEEAEIRAVRRDIEGRASPCFTCPKRVGEHHIFAPHTVNSDCGKKMVPYPLWSPEEFKSFMQEVKAKKLLRHGAKKKLSECEYPMDNAMGTEFNLNFQNTVEDWIMTYGNAEAWCELCNAVWDLDIRTLQGFFNSKKQKPLDFPAMVAERFGFNTIKETPPIVIGTIHSVKGGEADAVFVIPDLSPRSYQDWSFDQDVREDIIRQFYVAMTRTRDQLYLCSPATNATVDWL